MNYNVRTLKTTLKEMTKQLFASLALAITIAISGPAQAEKQIRVKLNDETLSLNANFPKDYSERTFIKGLAMYRNKIEELAGCLIILDDNEKASVIGQYINRDQPPIKNITLSDVLYSSKINSSASVNGSYMIASASASTSSIIELIITDINGVLIPEQSIPYLEICKAARNVDADTKKKIYYIRSVKLTAVHSKAFKEVKADLGINGVVFSAGGKVYNSSDHFKTDYVVSVDMVSFTNLLITKNCDEIITYNELAIRQAAENAQQNAEKAETERKIKENEMNSAKAELNDLKNELDKLTQNLRQRQHATAEYKMVMDSLQNSLITAQQKVEEKTEGFTKADDNLKQVAATAEAQQSKSEGIDMLIQKADISVITAVKQLSESEIKSLGFEQIEQ